ncbi:MAG: anthranilate synthase component I family protein [Elusimicrobiota bacterium]
MKTIPCVDRRLLWKLSEGSAYRVWLDGGETGRSLFGWGEPLWVFDGSDGRGEVRQEGGGRRFSFHDPSEVLRGLLSNRRRGEDRLDGFSGGAAGFWGYECGKYFERAPRTGSESVSTPEFLWFLPRFWAAWEKGEVQFWVQKNGVVDRTMRQSWESILPKTATAASRPPAPPQRKTSAGAETYFPSNRTSFTAAAGRALEYIASGDIYQANISHRLDLPWRGETEAFFHELLRLNPSPYAVLLETPEFTLASCSPELLLSVRGDHARTRPIAGTRPRGSTPEEDEKLSGELLLSPKERAEHVMLLDLERNDLGRVCRAGTVEVTDRMALEKYSHVTHIVSQVEGRLRAGLDGFDAFKAVFPGGTITGCPKVRCMEIIRELEGEPRGPFYGSAGWTGFDGDMDLNILIRTALIRKDRMSLRVGAGIVADSDPDREYEETLHKAGALLAAHRAASRAAATGPGPS